MRRNRTQRPRCSGGIRVFHRLKRVRTPAAWCTWLVRRHDARWGARWGSHIAHPAVVVLKSPERGLELLISVLHLLDLTGQLTNLVLQAINSDHKLRGTRLRKCARRDRRHKGG